MRFRRNLMNICTAREVCKMPRAKFSRILRLWFFAPLLDFVFVIFHFFKMRRDI